MKKLGKKIVAAVLAGQVKKLSKKNDFKVVALAGSVGKTTTKFAIVGALSKSKRVRFQEGNYNDIITVPLVFFGVDNPPNLTNPIAWLKIFKHNRTQLKKPYPFEVVVIELGIDGPGQMAKFGKFLKPDVGVLTSIGLEHMEFFDGLEEVAREEMKLSDFCKVIIANTDDIEPQFVDDLKAYSTYGHGESAEYRLVESGQKAVIKKGELTWSLKPALIGLHLQKSLAAAVAVCDALNCEINEEALENIQPVSGRMQLLKGKDDSFIIDDTYNNVSPVSAIAALDVLYDWDAKRKIAVLGNMNELGEHSEDAHRKVGRYCDSEIIAELYTIGPDANNYLAEEAEKKGCLVERFDSPHDIALRLKETLTKDTVVLFKGSQNRVFLEEAIRPLLKNPADITKLVRQSDKWIKHKNQQFGV